MRRKWITVALTVVMTLSMGITVSAAGWQKNDIGWWWQMEDGTYPIESWQWLDGNKDGIAECYYFDSLGYMLENATTPDGYTVNTEGMWTIGGVVQTKNVPVLQVNAEIPDVEGTYKGVYQGHQVIGVIEKGFNGNFWVEIDFFIKDDMPPYIGNNVFEDVYTRYTFNGNTLTVEDLYAGDTFQLTKQ